MAFEVNPTLWPTSLAPAAILRRATSREMAYESSMVMVGQVVESWVACLRSFSALIRMSAALLRSASDSIFIPPSGVGCAKRRCSRQDNHQDNHKLGHGACARSFACCNAGRPVAHGASLLSGHANRARAFAHPTAFTLTAHRPSAVWP